MRCNTVHPPVDVAHRRIGCVTSGRVPCVGPTIRESGGGGGRACVYFADCRRFLVFFVHEEAVCCIPVLSFPEMSFVPHLQLGIP